MNKKILIIVIVVLLVVLGGAGFVIFTLLQNTGEEKELPTFVVDIAEPFTTNSEDMKALVKTTVSLVSNNKDVQVTYDTNTAAIKNAIIFCLKNKTLEDVSSPTIEATLSTEICAKLNEFLGDEIFIKVYFSEFIVQK